MKKRKNKPGQGRPSEGRVRVQITILPDTEKNLRAAMNEKLNTLGKVVDEKFESPWKMEDRQHPALDAFKMHEVAHKIHNK